VTEASDARLNEIDNYYRAGYGGWSQGETEAVSILDKMRIIKYIRSSSTPQRPMSYQIDADYTRVMLFPPSLEDFVSADDPVRFIRAFVDSLDLKELGFKIRENVEGRPGFASSLLLKIWLFGSYERTHSSRSLERQCKRDIGLLWLTGMNYPDHNTLWRFWNDNNAVIKQLFKQSVQVALKNDLVGMVYHAIDGTKIGACASRFKGLNKEEMGILQQRLDEYVEAMARKVEESQGVAPDDRLPAALQDAKELQRRVHENVEELRKKKKGTLSPMDIDSRKMRTNRGTVEFSYNAQAVADQKCGVIVGAAVSQAETDHHLLTPMLEEVRETSGSNAKSSVADAGYFSGIELEKAEAVEHGADIYVNIPTEHNRSAEKTCGDPYHGNNFTYNKERDVFVCPRGCELERERMTGEYVIYSCKNFAACPNKSLCTTSTKRKRLCVHRCHESIRRHKQKIANESAKELLRQRGALIERVFGWIKEQYKLRRFSATGIKNAKAMWYLACTVYNLRKIFSCTNGVVQIS
jgi:transposase